ncbi:zinc finger protein 2-like [Thunnus albacares]|uniref:zinc finger protein 2-like n=1 Tax=Thunnus albacares TaxID=8236 RepID=UPI001CF638DE|nr:zinc finger protein 2-like [Thunnus albacares]
MSQVQRLRLFVSQRLNAAVEEILGAFEKMIDKYEQEAALSQEVISRQHALLCALHKPIMELPPAVVFTQQLSVCKVEAHPELQNQEDQRIEEEVVGELDEADIIEFTYSSGRAVASLSAAGTETRAPDIQVLSSSEAETEDSEDYNQDTAETRSAPDQQRAGLFGCRVCSRTFRLRRMLFRHVRAHLQEAEPVCGMCGERLEAADSLELHLQTHLSIRKRRRRRKTKKNPEPESQSRERPFHRRSHRDTNANTSEKTNTCDDCGKTFLQVWRKTRHRCRPRRRNQNQQRKTSTS